MWFAGTIHAPVSSKLPVFSELPAKESEKGVPGAISPVQDLYAEERIEST